MQGARTVSSTKNSHAWHRRQGLGLKKAMAESLLGCEALLGVEREQFHQQVQDRITKPSRDIDDTTSGPKRRAHEQGITEQEITE